MKKHTYAYLKLSVSKCQYSRVIVNLTLFHFQDDASVTCVTQMNQNGASWSNWLTKGLLCMHMTI